MRKASGSDGSYLPVSIALTLWRDTSSRSARSCWLQLRSARSTRRRFSISSRRRAERQLVDARAEAQAAEPQDRDIISVDVADEVEAFEEAPDRRDAEREAARPQRLPDHQHADIFVLLLDQIAADRGEDADDRKSREDRREIGHGAGQQVVLEAVDGRQSGRMP